MVPGIDYVSQNLMFTFWLPLDDFLFLARWDRLRLELLTPDLPDSIAATTEDCSSNDDIFVVFSNIDADLRPLATCSPAVSTDPAVKFISPPASPSRHLPDQTTNQLALIPFLPLKPVTTTPQLKHHQLQACNFPEMTVMRINTSFPRLFLSNRLYPTSFTPQSVLTPRRDCQFSPQLPTSQGFSASKPTAIFREHINSQ